MGDKRLSLKKGEEAARLSTIILLALGILKGLTSLASGSVALLAGSIDSFSDVFSSIAVWVGLRIAKKKPTERFPYGYYKAETFALLSVSLILIASSIFIMLDSFEKLFEVYVISFSDIALAVAGLSTVVYYALARYKSRVGRKIGSQALISEGVHSMIDVYTSLLVFLGVILAVLGYSVGEALIGFIIGLYVFVRALFFGKDAALVLMDVSPNPKMAKQISEIAQSVRGVIGTHDIRLRKSGPVLFGEVHVELQEGLSLEKAHVISEEVERKIKERFQDIELVTVHIGLSHKKKMRIGIPVEKDNGLDSPVNRHFATTPFFAFIDIESGQTISFYVKQNEAAFMPRKKGIQAANLLVKENVDGVIASNIGEAPFHVLSDSLVLLYRLPNVIKISEVILLLNQNRLEKMTEPTQKGFN